jgi:acyl-CoA synthetase (AMP-forming)/AMP-acid ligase II
MQFGVWEAIAHWARYRGDVPALVEDGIEIPFRELARRARCVAAGLQRTSTIGDRVAVAVAPKSDLLAAIIGALSAGRSAVVLHHGLPESSAIVNFKDAAPAVFIHDGSRGNYERLFSQAGGKVPLRYDELLRLDPASDDELGYRAREADHEWGVIFSSGTTGPSKAIERHHYSIVTELLGWCLELGLSSATKFYVGRPFYYTGGLVLALATLVAGGTVYCSNGNDLGAAAEWNAYQRACKLEQIDWVFLVPDQIRAFCSLVRHLSSEDRSKVGSARKLLVMGAPITGAEKLGARELLRSDIIESWGNSESLGTITDLDSQDLRPKSIGRPFLTDELYIVDENRLPLGPLKVGRIAGSADAGFIAYSNRPEETQRVKKDNLIISDDLGYVDEDGFFYIVGRIQDAVLQNGITVYLPELEGKIRERGLFKECSVVALESTNGILIVVAAVLEGGIPEDPSILKQSVNDAVGGTASIESVVVLETLPKTPTGKIDREALAAILTERLGGEH